MGEKNIVNHTQYFKVSTGSDRGHLHSYSTAQNKAYSHISVHQGEDTQSSHRTGHQIFVGTVELPIIIL